MTRKEAETSSITFMTGMPVSNQCMSLDYNSIQTSKYWITQTPGDVTFQFMNKLNM